MTRPIVLYFVGKGRSGTTLIDNVLGQVDGFVSTGELNKLWTWGFQHGWSCGCGEPIPACPFWNAVLDAGWADTARPETERMVRLHRAVLRWPNVPRLLLHRGRALPTGWYALDEYCAVLERLYRGIAEVSGAQVIVDSSKWPAAPTALDLVPGIDVRLLHVVRDPRAVVNSWQRVKRWRDRGDGQQMPRYGVLYSMASYWARNVVAEVLARGRSERFLRVRYEDLVDDPQRWFGRIVRFCGGDPAGLPLSDGKVRMGPSHTAGGNPDRLTTGQVEIRPDERWREELDAVDGLLATALGLPLVRRYDYPIGP